MSKENNKTGRKYRILSFLAAFSIPFIAIVISVILVTKGVSLNEYFFSSEKISDEIPAEELNEEKKMISAFKGSLEPIFTVPSKLVIKNIALDVPLVSVGVEEDGAMETPDKWELAGWFRKSGMPGEEVNLIINGHYDTNTGGKAAFYNLKDVDQGDTVEVIDEYGRIFTYKVIELEYVDTDDPTRLDVLKGEQGKSTLTLITCGGVWTSSGYNKRLVVKAQLEGRNQVL